MGALKRPGKVMLMGTSAIEHVGQISAFARFSFESPNGILGHHDRCKPAYEKGRKWKQHLLSVSM